MAATDPANAGPVAAGLRGRVPTLNILIQQQNWPAETGYSAAIASILRKSLHQYCGSRVKLVRKPRLEPTRDLCEMLASANRAGPGEDCF
jgi:hypothetical protein